jgi:CRISPR-associated protein Cas2
MLILIAYDISTTCPEGKRRLKRIAKICQDHGIRVQKSLFECSLPFDKFKMLREQLVKVTDPLRDSLRFYVLGDHLPVDDQTGGDLGFRHIEAYGVEPNMRFGDAIFF